MKKIVIVLIILVAAACVLGYFFILKPKPQPEKPGTALQPQVQETPEQKKEELEEELKSIARFADANPLAVSEIERKVKEFKEKVSPSSFLSIRADRILTDAKWEFQSRAQKAFSDIERRAQELLARIQQEEGFAEGKKKDYTDVLQIINSCPAGFARTDYYAKLREMREQVKFYVDACDVWEKHKTDAFAAYYANDLDRALKILNDFPEKYRTSEWEKKRQELLTQYQSEKQDVITQEETEEKMTWHPLYSGESDLRNVDWDPQPESDFVVKDGTLIITCPSGRDFVSMTTGSDDWAEFILEIDMRLVRGSVMFAVRGTVDTEDQTSKTYRFDKKIVGTGDFESGGWQKLKVRVKDNRIEVSSPGLRGTRENSCDRKSGPIGLFVLDSAEVQIKSIKIAFYGQEPASWIRRQEAKEEEKPEEKKEEEEKPEEGE